MVFKKSFIGIPMVKVMTYWHFADGDGEGDNATDEPQTGKQKSRKVTNVIIINHNESIVFQTFKLMQGLN